LKTVLFHYSIGSRYSYLAATQLAALSAETGCRFEWIPVNSADLMSRLGRNPFAGTPVSGQYDWSYRERDAKRWAALYGVSFVEPRGRVEFDPGLLALACTAAKQLGKVEDFSRGLFAAMFIDPLTRIDLNECMRRAEDCGLPPEEFRRFVGDSRTARELDEVTRKAVDTGVFGVPTFVAGGELFWGNDRLVLLREYLSKKRW
jgi:2-hydroxychromene-2-carboxylate isomerase